MGTRNSFQGVLNQVGVPSLRGLLKGEGDGGEGGGTHELRNLMQTGGGDDRGTKQGEGCRKLRGERSTL